MKIKIITTSPIKENSYIFYDENTLDAVAIDPGDLEDGIIDFIEHNNLKLNKILLTHTHFDHVMGVEKLKDIYNVDIICHTNEKELLYNENYDFYKDFGVSINFKVDRYVENEDVIQFGNHILKVIHTPGHTPGSVCFYSDECKVLFSGDTLFYGTVGRTDFYLSVPKDLPRYVKERLFVLDDKVVVYCGHGLKTSIAFEKKNNPYLK